MSSKNVELRKEEFRVMRREESLCLGLGSSQGPRPCAPPPRRRPNSRARPTPRRRSSRAGADASFGYLVRKNTLPKARPAEFELF